MLLLILVVLGAISEPSLACDWSKINHCVQTFQQAQPTGQNPLALPSYDKTEMNAFCNDFHDYELCMDPLLDQCWQKSTSVAVLEGQIEGIDVLCTEKRNVYHANKDCTSTSGVASAMRNCNDTLFQQINRKSVQEAHRCHQNAVSDCGVSAVNLIKDVSEAVLDPLDDVIGGDDDDDDKDDELGAGAIIGIVLGVLLVLAGICAAIFFCTKASNKTKQAQAEPVVTYTAHPPSAQYPNGAFSTTAPTMTYNNGAYSATALPSAYPTQVNITTEKTASASAPSQPAESFKTPASEWQGEMVAPPPYNSTLPPGHRTTAPSADNAYNEVSEQQELSNQSKF